MDVEFLFFEGCLGRAKAWPLLEEVLAEEGVRDPVRFIKVANHDDAVRHRFQGSPTIRINGRDIVEQSDVDYAMRCRVYWVDGQPRDYPSKEMIREAVRAAGGERQ